MPRPRFYVPDIRADSKTAALPPDEAHHLLHVLRLEPGAGISIFDGRGREWAARVLQAGRRAASVIVALEDVLQPAAEPPVQVTLGIGLLKGDQMDGVVRDATMLGVAEVVPLASEHVTVPARAWKSGAAIGRWQRVAVASAKQCGRAVVPRVSAVQALTSTIERAGNDIKLMCVEPAHSAAYPVDAGVARPRTALVLVGPEGGWSAAEIALAARHDVRLIHLGPRTLRAETAPTVLLSALWTIWGW